MSSSLTLESDIIIVALPSFDSVPNSWHLSIADRLEKFSHTKNIQIHVFIFLEEEAASIEIPHDFMSSFCEEIFEKNFKLYCDTFDDVYLKCHQNT